MTASYTRQERVTVVTQQEFHAIKQYVSYDAYLESLGLDFEIVPVTVGRILQLPELWWEEKSAEERYATARMICAYVLHTCKHLGNSRIGQILHRDSATIRYYFRIRIPRAIEGYDPDLYMYLVRFVNIFSTKLKPS